MLRAGPAENKQGTASRRPGRGGWLAVQPPKDKPIPSPLDSQFGKRSSQFPFWVVLQDPGWLLLQLQLLTGGFRSTCSSPKVLEGGEKQQLTTRFSSF